MIGLLGPALVGSMLLAVLSTVADYVWFLDIPQHQVSSGMIHGSVLFAALGGYLGWRKGKAVAGAIGGLLSGMLAALSFYALAPIGGYSMMLVSWLLLWIMLAALQSHLDGRVDLARAVGRGTVVSIAAGLGFAVVLFQLYRGWPPAEFPVFRHLVAWSMAYLPGLYVLLKR
jgi:hypothetical protein